MMISRCLVWLLLMLIGSSLSAQQGSYVNFHEPVAHLGTIIDNRGVVDHQFSFTNQSSKPLIIEKVTTSCGCTSTNWTIDSIVAGSDGFIEVQFDPYNRPGPFEKQATVHFKDYSDSITLTVKGFVRPAANSISEEFPIKMGALRAKSPYLELGTITRKSLFSKSFEVYNESDQILVFSDDMEGPNHITVTFEPYTLRPNTAGKMWIHYDVKAKNDLGYFNEDISIFTYESSDNRKSFRINTTLLDIPTEKTAESPRVQFSRKEVDFGIKQQGDTVRTSFTVKNVGRSSLRLKKLFGNCNCIKVTATNYQIEPGASSDIAVRFVTSERLGNQEKTVTVFTDDPLTPVAILKIKGRLRGSRN